MAEYISEEIRSAAKALADLIRADGRYQAYEAAAKAYETDTEVLGMITEYNVHPAALSDQYAKEERDQAMIDSIQRLIFNSSFFVRIIIVKFAIFHFSYCEICCIC